jgi:hypothetical protein
MPAATVVPDDVLSRLLAVRPVRYGDAEALDAVERAFGLFDPPPELLREAIDAVFWASLTMEEGKPALTRVEMADISGPQCCLEPRPVSAAALAQTVSAYG